MGNPEPNLYFDQISFYKKSEIKKDRCRDSTEAILTNRVGYVILVVGISLSNEKQKMHSRV